MKDAWGLYFEELEKDKCNNCNRKLADGKMRRKNKCVWCDNKRSK